MSPDEFLKQHNPPIRSRFRLSPHHSELWKLKKFGCTLGQIKEFLKLNGVETSTNNLSHYFLNNSENQPSNNSNSEIPYKSMPIPNQAPIPPKINTPEKVAVSQKFPPRANTPEELRKIMYAPVDFKAIIKAAKDIEDAEKAAKLLNK